MKTMKTLWRSMAVASAMLLTISIVVELHGRDKTAFVLTERAYWILLLSVTLSLIYDTLKSTKLATKSYIQKIFQRLNRLQEITVVNNKLLSLIIAVSALTSASLMLVAGQFTIPGRPINVITLIIYPRWARVAYNILSVLVSIMLMLSSKHRMIGAALLLVSTMSLDITVPYVPAFVSLVAILIVVCETLRNNNIHKAFVTIMLCSALLLLPIPEVWWLVLPLLPMYTIASLPLLCLACIYIVYKGVTSNIKHYILNSYTSARLGLTKYINALSILILTSTILTLIPRFMYGLGLYSLNTLTYISLCEYIRANKIRYVFIKTNSLLYTILTLYPMAIFFNCNGLLIDLIIPLLGLVLTGLTIFRIIVVHSDETSALLGAASTIAWFAPIYVYAGFQSMLLALPLTYLLLERLEKGEKPLLEAVVLALWHPWVFGYATLVYLVSCWFRRRRPGEREVLALLAGWIAYLSFRAFIGGAGVERTVVAVSRGTPLAWTILYYLGGTLQRPDVYAPLAATLLVSSSLTTPYWLLASVVTAFASILVPNTILAERILSATPLPAYTTLLLARSGARKHLYLYAAYTVATAVFILMHVKPISHPAYAP